MSSEQPSSVPAPRMPADLSGRDPAQTLAGLIDMLDRADGVSGRPRPRTHRSAAHRSAAYRTGASRAGAVRSVPLRSVPPAPMARRPAQPAGAGPIPAQASPAGARPSDARSSSPRSSGVAAPLAPPRPGLIRRLALWGAGSHGENLAWHISPVHISPVHIAPVHIAPEQGADGGVRTPALRRLTRRLALWGAGAHGENLAWGRPAVARPARRELDPPVVLRAMPSTPTIEPAASSPAAALRPAGPAVPGPRVSPPEPTVGWCSPPVQSSPEPSAWSPPRTGWPQPREWPPSRPVGTRSTPPSPPASRSRSSNPTSTAPAVRSRSSSPAERGLARARGDPLCSPARGSPPPVPRSRPSTPSALIWSPAPASSPPPCPAPSAPG